MKSLIETPHDELEHHRINQPDHIRQHPPSRLICNAPKHPGRAKCQEEREDIQKKAQEKRVKAIHEGNPYESYHDLDRKQEESDAGETLTTTGPDVRDRNTHDGVVDDPYEKKHPPSWRSKCWFRKSIPPGRP